MLLKSLPIREFEEAETALWEELKSMQKRLPCVEVYQEPSSSVLFFEKEVVGLRLFGDLFDGEWLEWSASVDLPPNATVLTGKEAETMYLHSIHMLSGKLLSRYHSLKGRKREGGEEGSVVKRKCSSCFCLL